MPPGRSTGKRQVLLLALIPVIGAIIIALIQFNPFKQNIVPREDATSFVISGTVVNANTNAGISLAEIQIAGKTETYRTENNGNFRFEIMIDTKVNKEKNVRVIVNARGFQTLHQSISLPAEGVIFPLVINSQ